MRRLPAIAMIAMVATLAVAAPVPTARAQDAATPSSAPLVRLPFPQDDGTLTPYTFELGYALVTLVYDTLLWRDAGGVPQPWLARSVDTSPDGLRLTIRLVDDARWHDGHPVTADDVVFTFRHVAARFHPRFTPEVAPVAGVEATGATTVTITLEHPAPGFADQPLADLPILPAHLWRGLPADRLAPDGLPVGSGPYRLVEHRPGERYRFEAFTDWFRGRPAVGAVEVPVIGDAEDTLRALERRDVDMLPVSLPETAVDRLDGLATRIVDGPTYSGTVLLLNVRTAPFDRPEARRAVARALDLGQLARAVGNAVPADRGYLHPDSPWSTDEVLHRADTGAAPRELASAGVRELEVLSPDNDPVKAEAGRQVVLALERAGVRARARSVSSDELSAAVGEGGGTPTFQAAIWPAPALASYDPDFLRRVFGSPPEDGSLNYSGYRSARFDDLARRIASTPGRDERRALVGEALRLLADDLPALPLLFATGSFAYRPAVYAGWVFVKGAGILDKRSFVEPSAGEPARPVAPEAGGGGGGFPFGLAALTVAAVAVVVGVVGLRRSRR